MLNLSTIDTAPDGSRWHAKFISNQNAYMYTAPGGSIWGLRIHKKIKTTC